MMRRLLVLALLICPLLAGAQVTFTPSNRTGGSTVVVAASTSKHAAGADYICDGTSDDVEIGAAIAALPTAGGRVLLLEGTYDIRAPITMKSNLWLQGQGPGTILKLNKAAWVTGGGETYMLYDGPAHAQTTQNNITISDLTIDHDSWGGPAYIQPFVFWGYWGVASNNRVERCVIKNGFGYAILVLNNQGFHAAGNTISAWGDSCIEMRSTRGAVISDNSFSTCSMQTYADHAGANAMGGVVMTGNDFTNVGIYVADPLTGWQVNGFLFASNTWRVVGNVGVNLWFNAVKGLVIAGNIFDTTLQTRATPNEVLELPNDTVTDVRIVGNTFDVGTLSGGGTACAGGLDVAGGVGIRIADNVIRCPTAASGTAIAVQSADRVTVERNVLDTWATGISIAATATASRVLDNGFTTVTTPYSLLDTTALFRDQAGMAFAALPADVADGSLVYCSDCTIASPCAAGGTGALAKRLNNTYVCN